MGTMESPYEHQSSGVLTPPPPRARAVLLVHKQSSVFPVLRPSRVDLPTDPAVSELQLKLEGLTLSNEAIATRETVRIASTKELLEQQRNIGLIEAGTILNSQTPWYVMVPYKALCWFLGE